MESSGLQREAGTTPMRETSELGEEKTFSEGSGKGCLSSEMLKIAASLRVKCLGPTGTQGTGTDKNAMASKQVCLTPNFLCVRHCRITLVCTKSITDSNPSQCFGDSHHKEKGLLSYAFKRKCKILRDHYPQPQLQQCRLQFTGFCSLKA